MLVCYLVVKRSGKGVGRLPGLGLAIVRRIVQLHVGRVKMESAEGAWARITICLLIDATMS